MSEIAMMRSMIGLHEIIEHGGVWVNLIKLLLNNTYYMIACV